MTDAPTRPMPRYPLVAFAVFFHFSGVMGTRPIVSLYATELGVGPGEIGILVAVFATLPLFLALRAGHWLDHFGSRPFLLGGTLCAGLGLVLPEFVSGRLGLYASQVVTGSASTLFILAAQRSVGTLATEAWARERNVAIFSLGVALASLAGPIPAGFIGERMGYGPAFVMMGCCSIVSLIICLRLPQDRPVASSRRATFPHGNPLRVLGYNPYMGRAFLISSLTLMAKDMYIAYFPLYASSIGLSATAIGLIIGLHNGGGVIMRLVLLRLVEWFGKNRVVIVSVFIAGVLSLILPLSHDILILTLASVGLGLALGLPQPLSISTTIALSPNDKLGEVLGVRLACNRLSQALVPLGFGGAVVFTGVAGVFVVVGVLLCAGATRLNIPNDQST